MAAAGKASANVFDEYVDEYEAACARGLELSGDDREYFAEQRIRETSRLCPPGTAPVRTIIDFGCGLGHSTAHFLKVFPHARVVGIDSSERAIEAANRRYGSDRARFALGDRLRDYASADLVYSNGTFHHIEPPERPAIVRDLLAALAPGGLFGLWENNPWNPGTRIVMSRIPFDKDAKTLSCVETRRLLSDAGFRVLATSFHFYFPAWLKPLRRLEPRLTRLPLGAQYCVLAQKPL